MLASVRPAKIILVKKISVSDLRFRYSEIEHALQRGQSFEVTKYNRVVGRLVPVDSVSPAFPDFAARSKKILGNRKLKISGAELIRRDRDRGF